MPFENAQHSNLSHWFKNANVITNKMQCSAVNVCSNGKLQQALRLNLLNKDVILILKVII